MNIPSIRRVAASTLLFGLAFAAGILPAQAADGDAADQWIDRMGKEGRYVLDVWSGN